MANNKAADDSAEYEYIIIGDTDQFKDCLICLAGRDGSHAEQIRLGVITSQSDRYSNIRVKKVKSSECWWNDPFLAN